MKAKYQPAPNARWRALATPLSEALRPWFFSHQRDLPWRRTSDPYAIWISEVMLQQTQVATVQPYYERFLRRFPDVQALAAAPQQQVLELWAGLGYYRRVSQLHDAARIIMKTYNGVFPSTMVELLALPGIGRYTAGAVASIAFGRSVPVLDGNVMRVLCRLGNLHADIARPATRKRLWQAATLLVPHHDPGTYNQALMELGATVCTPTAPRCPVCPARGLCLARRRGTAARLPARSTRGPTPLWQRWAAVVEAPGARLLLQRPGGGLWAHLWEFPTFERHGQPLTATRVRGLLRQALAIDVSVYPTPVRLRHQLTHRTMDYLVFTASTAAVPTTVRLPTCGPKSYLAHRWASDLDEVPVASVTRKILAAIHGRPSPRPHHHGHPAQKNSPADLALTGPRKTRVLE